MFAYPLHLFSAQAMGAPLEMETNIPKEEEVSLVVENRGDQKVCAHVFLKTALEQGMMRYIASNDRVKFRIMADEDCKLKDFVIKVVDLADENLMGRADTAFKKRSKEASSQSDQEKEVVNLTKRQHLERSDVEDFQGGKKETSPVQAAQAKPFITDQKLVQLELQDSETGNPIDFKTFLEPSQKVALFMSNPNVEKIKFCICIKSGDEKTHIPAEGVELGMLEGKAKAQICSFTPQSPDGVIIFSHLSCKMTPSEERNKTYYGKEWSYVNYRPLKET